MLAFGVRVQVLVPGSNFSERLPADLPNVENTSLLGSVTLVAYQRRSNISGNGDQSRPSGLNALVRRSSGLPPEAMMRPSSSVETPAQNMSWKLLSVLMNWPVCGSNTDECVNSRLAGNALVSVDDQVSTRPVGQVRPRRSRCAARR